MSARGIRTSSGKMICVSIADSGRAIGEDSPRAKYTDNVVALARALRDQGFSLGAISKKLEIPIRTLRGYLDGSRRAASVSGWRFEHERKGKGE